MNELPIYLSVFSIIVAFFTLGWTVYRDVYIKPRTKVIGIISMIHLGNKEKGPYIDVRLLNKGPGKLYVETIVAKLRKKSNSAGYLSIIYDYSNELNPKMPAEVEVDKKLSQFLPFRKDCVFSRNIKKLGYIDSLGRYHWMKKKYFREIESEYKKKFEEKT